MPCSQFGWLEFGMGDAAAATGCHFALAAPPLQLSDFEASSPGAVAAA